MSLWGVEELLAKTEELGRAGGRVENDALRAGAKVIEEAAKEEVPERTGQTREDIGIVGKVRKRGGTKTIRVGATTGRSSTVIYFLERGTSTMSANPFLSRAFHSNKDAANKAMLETLRKGLGL